MTKLDAGQIEAEAADAAGVSVDAAAGEFARNLRITVDSANEESELSAAGLLAVHEELSDGVRKRLQTDRWIAENPEISAEIIDRPLFLMGLPRSGTTYFQYLFDNDPALRLLRTWETARPAPAHMLTPEERAKRRDAAQQDGDKLRAAIPQFDAIHLNDTDGPDECHRFLSETMGAIGFHNCQNMPTFYRALLTEFDLDATYRIYKRQLQLLQWQTPQRRWALKYPNHLIAMDNIVRIFPDAVFVMTHRDPVQTLASLCKLTQLFRQSRSDHVDPLVVGRQIKEFVREHFERMLASRRDPSINKRVIDVDYYRLVDAPDVVLAEVYDKLGTEMPELVRSSIANWRQNNPPGKRGKHDYALDAFGLNAEDVAEEYKHYAQSFDIPRESQMVRAA